MQRTASNFAIVLMISFSTWASPVNGQGRSRDRGAARSTPTASDVGDGSRTPFSETPNESAKPRILGYELTEMPEGDTANAAHGRDAQPVVVLSDQEILRRRTSGTSAASGAGIAEAIVYANVIDTGNWTIGDQRFSFTPTMSSTVVNSLGFPIPTNIGTFIADDMTPRAGWQVGDQISSFSAFVRRSGTDQTRFIGDGTARATLTLWDGDPINEIDTTGSGFASAPIPGATCDFTLSPDVPFATLQNLKCNLATPITPPHDNVWMVLTSDSCRLFWPITLLTARVGFSKDLGIIGQDDDAGTLGTHTLSTAATTGTCCNDDGGTTCGPAGVTLDCPGDPLNEGGRCSDGDAETHLAFNFGGPCVGDFNTDSCVNYLAQINAPARVTMSVVPVAGDGNVGISGNEIRYDTGGGTATVELRFGNWDPDRTGEKLMAFVAKIYSPGYASGLQGVLTLTSVPCTADSECVALYGGACSILGTPCNSAADCTGGPGETCDGPVCDRRFSSDPPGLKVCLPVYITSNRSDFVFWGVRILDAVDLSDPTGSFRWAISVGSPELSVTAPDPFPPGGRYGGTMHFDIPPDSKGTFTLGFTPVADTSMVNGESQFFRLVGIVPAKITVTIGVCCFNLSENPTCIEYATSVECDALPGPRLYRPGSQCGATPGQCAADCNGNGVPDFLDVVDGTLSDCDANGAWDACEIADGTGVDCNLNDVLDACEIADGTGGDCDLNGVLDACEALCVAVGTPQPEPVQPTDKNRYVSFQSVNSGCHTAIRLTPTSLSSAFQAFVGRPMWLSNARAFCEASGQDTERPCPPAPGAPSRLMWTATLSCTPVYRDWGSLGTVHVFHEIIVPDGTYELQEIHEGCGTGSESSFSGVRTLRTNRWGDVAGPVDPGSGTFTPPDGGVHVTDIVAVLAKFRNSSGAPIKPRVDLSPSVPDQITNVLDIVWILNTFGGQPYPFAPTLPPCSP